MGTSCLLDVPQAEQPPEQNSGLQQAVRAWVPCGKHREPSTGVQRSMGFGKWLLSARVRDDEVRKRHPTEQTYDGGGNQVLAVGRSGTLQKA